MPVQDWIVAAIVALTPVGVAILKYGAGVVNKEIPSVLLPIIASAAGALVAYLSGLSLSDPVWLAVVGFATVGLREFIDQLKKAVKSSV